MKMNVDQNMCIGCGMCAGMCAEVFRMGDEGKAEAYGAVDATNEANAMMALEGCPVGAISKED